MSAEPRWRRPRRPDDRVDYIPDRASKGEIISIGDIGEFGLIERITANAGPMPPHVLIGPGDDAAVVAAPDGRVVISTDALVEGRHFRIDWASAHDVGRRSAAASLADIVAMGAVPTSIVVALGAPIDLSASWATELSAGLAEECAVVGAVLVGGDLYQAPRITITVTALGDLGGRAPVTRSGAQVGDVVAVIGRLGYAAAGLSILSRGFRSGAVFIEAYRRPEPPYSAGPEAARQGATAMCDISDGLVQDLGHIAAASGVHVDLNPTAFELPQRMVEIASALGKDPLSWVLAGGDDHSLVATFPPSPGVPSGWVGVGHVVEQRGDVDGLPVPPVTVGGVDSGLSGWRHFSR